MTEKETGTWAAQGAAFDLQLVKPVEPEMLRQLLATRQARRDEPAKATP